VIPARLRKNWAVAVAAVAAGAALLGVPAPAVAHQADCPLHGTSLPHLIPGRPSHGCVRLRNKDILWLAYHMPVRTPIAVVN
jgi:hypothetical protein